MGEAAPSGRPVPPLAVGNALREVAGLADGGEEAEGAPQRREDVGIDVGHTRLSVVAPSERLQAL